MTGEGIGPALTCARLAAVHARRALERGRFTKAALRHYGKDFHRTFDRRNWAAKIVRAGLAYPWAVNHLIRRAAADPTLAQALNDMTSGIISPTILFRPNMALRIAGFTLGRQF